MAESERAAQQNSGYVFYDGACPFCARWAHHFERSLKTHGFEIVALQSHGAAERLRIEPPRLLDEMRVLTADGRVFGGADGAVELSRHFWWAKPLLWFSKLPGGMELLRMAYRAMARRRTCGVEGVCKAPSTNIQAPDKLQVPNANAIVRIGQSANACRRHWGDWVPLTLLPLGAVLFRNCLPAWVFMWVLAFAMFVGCKWLTWRRAWRNGCCGTIARSLGYLFAWPGMEAKKFLAESKSIRTSNLDSAWNLDVRAWSFATAKTLAGAGLIWLAARDVVALTPLATGWVAMLGIVWFLHFGLFDLLAAAWHRAGVEVTPVMRSPLRATSLADFWSRRWNTAFHTLAHELIFRPVGRRWGAVRGTIAAFVISGLVHDAVISFPARGGYGLPTAYFLLQALGVLIERSSFGRWLKLGKGIRGWLYVILFTAGPMFWLFHPPFIKNVILPMLHAFGAS